MRGILRQRSGGVIGIEWASMLHDFGVKVTVLEAGSQIIPTEDHEIAHELHRILTLKGVQIFTNVQLDFTKTELSENEVTLQGVMNEGVKAFTSEKVLLSVGRIANIEGIGIENTDIKTDRGVLLVNEQYQTAEQHIYAIGDCIGGLQLAHVASHEGIYAVEHIAGVATQSNPEQNIAKCIYCSPEIASIGLTEQTAREQGFEVKIGKFPFKGIGKALIKGDTEGFVKIIADSKTDDILGVHMIGPNVTELISEAGLAVVLNATPWEVGKTIHPHPSLAEIMGEAALAVDGKAIHF